MVTCQLSESAEVLPNYLDTVAGASMRAMRAA